MADLEPAEFNNVAKKYFSRTNFLNKRIIADEKLLIKYLGSRWHELPLKHKDALIDLLLVDDNIRNCYIKPDSSEDASSIQESFPRLYINSGNKINVDFENDLWTWRDEHSGPFSWMSRSQQDLTLSDLEPDNILKPQPKSAKVDTEEDKAQNAAQAQFTYPSSSWCHDIIDDFRKNEDNITLTPCISEAEIHVRAENLRDETNSAFHESSDDSTPAHGHSQDTSPSRALDQETVSVSDRKSKGKDRSRRSPSPKKILRSGSCRKSTSNATDYGEQKLINGDDPELDDRANAFSNPVMESEWSTFVGHSQNGDSSPSVALESPVVYAPGVMMIDRGDYNASYSPGGDYSCLLESTDSPAQTSSRCVASPNVSEWSTQSTPDHSTHLLRGTQSPVHQKSTKMTQPITLATIDLTYGKDIALELEAKEAEEILTVEREGDKIVVTTQLESKRDSDIPVSGFDFLDNW